MITVPPGYYSGDTRFAFPHVGQVTVTTSPTLIVPANKSRLSIVITNAGTATVYIDSSQTPTTGGSHALLAGNSISLVSTTGVYGIVATGTQQVTFFEEEVR